MTDMNFWMTLAFFIFGLVWVHLMYRTGEKSKHTTSLGYLHNKARLKWKGNMAMKWFSLHRRGKILWQELEDYDISILYLEFIETETRTINF